MVGVLRVLLLCCCMCCFVEFASAVYMCWFVVAWVLFVLLSYVFACVVLCCCMACFCVVACCFACLHVFGGACIVTVLLHAVSVSD